MLGTLLAPYGVVAIPPEIIGHLLPLFMKAAPGVIFNGDPRFSLWEYPPQVGRTPPHRTGAGSLPARGMLRVRDVDLLKYVDGLYDREPRDHPDARFVPDATVGEL